MARDGHWLGEGFDPLLAKLELEAMTIEELKDLLKTNFSYDDDDFGDTLNPDGVSKSDLIDEAWLWINPAPDPVDEDEAAADAAATLHGDASAERTASTEAARAGGGAAPAAGASARRMNHTLWRAAAAVALAALICPLFFPQLFLKLRGIDQLLSADPRIEQIDAFLSPAQCQSLRAIAERRGGEIGEKND